MSYHPTDDLYDLLVAGYTVTFDMEESTGVIIVTVSALGDPPKTYKDSDFGILSTIRTEKMVPRSDGGFQWPNFGTFKLRDK